MPEKRKRTNTQKPSARSRAKKATEKTEQVIEDDVIEAQENAYKITEYTEDDLLPTGSTMVNLAASGFASGGWKKGSINTLPGQSDAGKTFLALSGLTVMANVSKYKKYDLVMDNGECKGAFDMDRLFPGLKTRLVTPEGGFSTTIQQLRGNLLTQCKTGRPFFYVMDSLDSLKGDSDFEKAMKNALKAAKNDLKAITEIKKTMGMEKAKIIRAMLSQTKDFISVSESSLLILQQLTMKANAVKFEDPFTTSGGTAPYYFSTNQFWLKKKGAIPRQVKGTKVEVGNHVVVKCKKNHLNGKKRTVEFDLYDEYGIEEIGSMIDFLTSCNAFEKQKDTTNVKAHGFFSKFLNKNELIDNFYQMPRGQIELRKLCQDQWNQRESILNTGRKREFI